LFPLGVISLGLGTKVRERRRTFRYFGGQAAAAEATATDLNLDDVTRFGDRCTGWGAGQDNVALFEREQLWEVRAGLREREEQVLCGVVLDEVAVMPGTDP